MPQLENPTDQDVVIESKSWMTWFIRNPKVGYVLALIIALWGVFSTISIPKESAPYIAYGIVNISTVYQGVSAYDIDQFITQKIESKIKALNGINSINSRSRNSMSSITIEFDPDQDLTRALSDVRSKIDEVKAELPADITGPTIMEIDSALQPFVSVVLHGPYSDVELKDFGEKLKTHVEGITDVARVTISGGAQREIAVDLDPLKLQTYSLSAQDVITAISASHRDVPIGDMKVDGLEYSLRFEGRHKTANDIKNVQIKNLTQDGGIAVLRVGEVAEVTETGEDTDSIQRIWTQESAGKAENSITLSLSKNANKNIFDVANRVQPEAEKYVKNNFPADLKISYIRDIAPVTRDDFNMVLSNAASSALAVLLLIFIFVGLKEGLVAGLVIPLSFMLTVGILNVMGMTLSFMTNFSMVLTLGILVDTAIVVVEGCHNYVRRGFKPYVAAMKALHEFRYPLISGTLTTLAVFIPLFTLPGIMGQYLSFIPITVFIALTSSLAISLLLITLFASRFLKPFRADEHKNPFITIVRKLRAGFTFIQNRIINAHGRLTAFSLKRRFMRIGLIYAMLFLFFASFAVPIKFVLFPEGDFFFFEISVKKENGTVTEITDKYVLPMEERLLEFPEVKTIGTEISKNSAQIYVELLTNEERKDKGMRTSLEIVSELQDEFAVVTDAEIEVRNAQSGPPSLAPVAFRVIVEGTDQIETAQKIAMDLKEILKTIPGTTGVKDDIEMIPGEIQYRVNREVAMAYAVNPDIIASVVRTALSGATAVKITRDGRDVEVKVKYRDDATDAMNKLENLTIRNYQGVEIPLKEVASYEMLPALNSISRVDTNIAFTITSLVNETGNAAEITTAFQKKIAEYKLPEGTKVEDAGENEENSELLTAMGMAFLIALLFMFLILVVQFKSYLQPFIILTTILFATIGVTAGLYFTGTPRSLAVILGMITLSGIVVNNAIILLDQINKKRAEAEKRRRQEMGELPSVADEAEVIAGGAAAGESTSSLINSIVEAARSRFNPIILTTLTTAAGILPLVTVDVFWAGLSYTVIFGLMMATFLTLYVTPAVYFQMDREKSVTLLPLGVLIALAVAVWRIYMPTPLFAGAWADHLFTLGAVLTTLILAYITFRAYLKAKRRDLEGA